MLNPSRTPPNDLGLGIAVLPDLPGKEESRNKSNNLLRPTSRLSILPEAPTPFMFISSWTEADKQQQPCHDEAQALPWPKIQPHELDP